MNRIFIQVLLVLCPWVLFAQTNPAPHPLATSNYSLVQWPSTSLAGTYPAAMMFQTCATANPALATPTGGDYTGIYNGSSGARFNGLSANGFYIAGANNAAPAAGAAVLALNTIGRNNVVVSWQSSTILTGNPAAVRLQYRVASDNGNWIDVPGPVEYASNGSTSLTAVPYSINLSTLLGDAVNNRPAFQLRWKYYRTSGTGANDCAIAFDEIQVTSSANPALAISTGLVPVLNNCVTPTVGTSFNLAFLYTPASSFTVGSVFTVQLSDENGSFVTPVNVGEAVCDVSGSQSASVTLPPNSVTGGGYRLRVVDGLTGTVGNDNGTNFAINLVPVAVTNITTNARYRKALIGWMNPPFCWDEVLVVARLASLPTGTPVGDGSLYNANAAYGQGSPLGDGFVVYKGTGSLVEVLGMIPEFSYGFTIWTRTGEDWISSSAFSVLTPEIPSVLSKQPRVSAAEYFWNSDPGAGLGIPFFVEDGNYDQAFEKLFRDGLQAPNYGRNVFNVRVRDTDSQWSTVYSTIVHVDSTDAFAGYSLSSLTQAEFWWNADPGVGNATPILAFDGNLNSAFEQLFKDGIQAPQFGRSTFNVRVKDNNQNWSSTFSTVVHVDSIDTNVGYPLERLIQAEYWWNADPGEGNATTLLALDGNINQAFEQLSASGLTPPNYGRSTFNVRVKDRLNNWSSTFTTVVHVDSVDTNAGYDLQRLVQAEYWWNNDPGEGNGTPLIALDGNFSSAFEGLFRNGLNAPSFGRSLFCVRVKGNDSVWSSVFKTVVHVDSLDTNSGYALSKVIQAEYWWNSDPGVGNATPMLALDGNLAAAFEQLTASGIQAPTFGRSTFNVRVKDSDNNWSAKFTTIVNVDSVDTVVPYFIAQNIRQQEFYWDNDPGEGNGTFMPAADGFAGSPFEKFNWPTNYIQNLPNGIHLLGMRSKDASGNWSPAFKTTVDVNFQGNTFVVYTNPSYSVRCAGQSVTLNALGGVSYTWSPATGLNTTTGATVIATPTQTTTYEVIGTNSFGLTSTAYVTVEVTEPGGISGPSEIDLCPGETAQLSSVSTIGNYWSTGETTQQITVSQGGLYTLITENGCGTQVHTVKINIRPITTPTITADGPTDFCIGSGVTLYASEGVDFLWSNGSTDPSVYITESGTYTVTVTPDGGCPASSLPVVINAGPIPNATLTAAGSTTICQGNFVTLNAPFNAGYTYGWLMDGLLVEGVTSSFFNVISSGFYSAIVTNQGCSALSEPIYVSVTPIPEAVITPAGSTTICSGSSVLLQGPTGAGLSYQWKLNNTNINGATGATYSATQAGNYTLVITANSCSSTSVAVAVTVTSLPTANTTVVGTLTFCQGGSVTLNASSGVGYTYQWNRNGSAIAGATNQSYTATTAGVYNVTVSANGCSATSTNRIVTVNPIPTAQITPSGSTSFCTGQSVQLVATTGAGYSYQWKLNNINISGAIGSTYTAIQPGSYTLTVSASACPATSSPVVVQTGSNVTPVIAVSTPSTTICTGASTTFTAVATFGGSAPAYQWRINGSNISGATSATFTTSALNNGDVVSCQLTSNAPCAAVTTVVSNGLTMTVNGGAAPAVSIALSAGSNPGCTSSTWIFTANVVNPGNNPSYQWKVNGVNVGSNGSTYTTNALVNNDAVTCVVSGTSSCGSAYNITSNEVRMVLTNALTPEVSIALTSGENPGCAGSGWTFNASQTNGGGSPAYDWRVNGVSTGNSDISYTVASLNNGDIVSCMLTSNAGCLTTSTALSAGITVTVITPSMYYADADGDGFGDAQVSSLACSPPVGYVINSTDCDDANNSVYPGAEELCNGQDDDCNTLIDEGLQPTQPTPVNCWDSFSYDVGSCQWVNIGTQPEQPTLACWEIATFNNTTCQWDISGEQPGQPSIECWETASFDNTSCAWTVAGEQPEQPILECGQTAVFNNVSCEWDVSGSPTEQPVIECWETATFNTVTCSWEVTGEQPAPPVVECWETATFNNVTCSWEVTGTQPEQPITACWETAIFNNATCSWDITGTQPEQPITACWEIATFNDATCSWEITGTQPEQPITACWETATFNNATCSWEVTGTQPDQPITACWETATFNNATCSWEVTGAQPEQPITACWETATFNNATCSWEVTGTQPDQPITACWETATFSNATCAWVVTGTQPEQPITACWETATFNNTTCSWDITGTQPEQPITACWETATFNNTTCSWDITGTQPEQPITACWETATFNNTTCSWNITGTQPEQPITACWETATFSNATCAWVVTGTQPEQPITACWETANFSNATCAWVVTGAQPEQPAIECWETATFNNVSCQWDVTGSQPEEPTAVNCWDNYQFSAVSCSWENLGQQPEQPTQVNCWDLFVFNSNSCTWDNVGVGTVFYADSDGDGFGNAEQTVLACSVPQGYSTDSTDCNDEQAGAYPGALEICNLIDDDCDGQIDEGVGLTFYLDNDGDGFGNAALTIVACAAPVGYVADNTDCDDTNASISPGLSEVCANTIDDNCSGEVNEGCCPILPAATAEISNAQCAALNNGEINLTVTAGVAPMSFVWSNASTSEDLVGLFAGSYSVTITDANGCQGSESFIVGNNNQGTTAPTVIDGPYGACRNSVGNVFSTPIVPGATSYQWILPTGATGSSTTNTIVLSFSGGYATGNLSVRAIGPCGISSTFTRTVYALTSAPAAPGSISGPVNDVCPSNTYTYTCSSVAAATSYVWTAPANATIVSGQGTQTVQMAFASNFGASGTISVRAVNCAGTSASQRTLTVFSVPSTPGTISGSANNVCPGSSQQYLIAAVSGASSYAWTAPTNATITAGQGSTLVTVSFNSSFVSGVLSVRAVSACGQSTTRTLTISRNPTTSSNITGQSSNLCGGGFFAYSIAAVNGAVNYAWTAPAGCAISSSSFNNVVLSVSPSFTTGVLSVVCSNSCGGSITRTLALTRLPATPASITGPASVCPSEVGVNFTTPVVSGVTNTWTVPTGATITAGQNTASMTCTWGTAAGSVTVRGVNACGQSTTRTKSVTLLACMEEQEGGAVSMEADRLSVYPNPNQGEFVIESQWPGEFELLNAVGQVVNRFALGEELGFSYAVRDLSAGVYFVREVRENGFVKRVIVAQ